MWEAMAQAIRAASRIPLSMVIGDVMIGYDTAKKQQLLILLQSTSIEFKVDRKTLIFIN